MIMKSDLDRLDLTRHFAELLVWAAIGICVGFVCAGCARGRVVITTTEMPSGETVTVTAPAPVVDPDLVIIVTQLTLQVEQILFDQWLRYEAQDATLDAAALAAETARRTERIDQLTAALQALYEARAKQ